MSNPTRTVLITGGTSGVGRSCALEIARQRPDYLVIIASRSDTNSAATFINQHLKQTNVQYLKLDLSNLANIRTFAETFARANHPPIAALLLNAGLQFPLGIVYTDDGIENTFAVNHIGHALLFYLLRPHLADGARVVITASGTHDPAQKTGLQDAEYTTAEALAHPSAESIARNNGRQRYATSKLCNVLWTYALHRRLASAAQTGTDAKTACTANAFDPGLMPGTGLAREAPWLLRVLWLRLLPHIIPVLRRLINANVHTPGESGAALARLAVGEDVESVSGKYFEGMKEIKSSVVSYEVEKQEDLWAWTAGHVARDGAEAGTFKSLS